jgi:hypothetical protein
METFLPLTLAPTMGDETSMRFVWPPAVAVMVTMAVPCSVPECRFSCTRPFSVTPVSLTMQSNIVQLG